MSALVPVLFYEDTLWAEEIDSNHPVAIKPICDVLQLDWSAQYRRIHRDAILAEGMVVMAIPSPGGVQETVCLPLALIPGFLFGIDDRRITDEAIRAKVLRYKRECHAALYAHFVGGDNRKATPRALMPGDPNFSEALRLVREAGRRAGNAAALAVWKSTGLPWVPELERPANPETPPMTGTVGDFHPVAVFAREMIEPAPGALIATSALYPAFTQFCHARDLPDAGFQSFAIAWARMGFRKKHSGGFRGYRDIRVKNVKAPIAADCH